MKIVLMVLIVQDAGLGVGFDAGLGVGFGGIGAGFGGLVAGVVGKDLLL